MNNKKIIQTSYLLVVTFLISMLLLACGSGGGDDRAGINSPVYSISGTVSGVQAAVSLSLSLKATQATSSVPTTGVFSFSNLTPGAYQVTPSLSGYRFDPSTTQVTVDGINQAVTIPTFTAILDKAPTYTISGTVTGAVQQGVSLRLSGSGSTYTTGTDGTYRFPGLASERTYTITPTLAGYIFAKGSLTVVGLHTDTTAPNFEATKNAAPTYSLSGTVTGAVLQNILITLNNGDTTSTNASGVYGFPALLAASYTVTPSKLGYTFSPASATVAVSALTTVPDFIATGKLNDTGITNMQCYQAASAVLGTCTATAATALNAAQDGMVGRDVTVADSSDGKLGFSFTKVCNSGELAGTGTCQTSPTGLVLGNLADNWGCTQDNVTGLMWEIKTNDVTNPGLRDWSKKYTNYSATADSVPSTYNTGSDATGFMTAVNNAGLCGHKDWRLPTADELQSILDYSVVSAPALPTVDTIWFPSTQANYFWSSSPYVGFPAFAWSVDFSDGVVSSGLRSGGGYVRLVRAGQ